MKLVIWVMFLPFAQALNAAVISWTDVRIIPGEIYGMPGMKGYDMVGDVISNGNVWSPIAGTEGSFLGYGDVDGFHLKQRVDNLQPGDDGLTAMVKRDNLWVLTYYGELLNEETIGNAERILTTDGWYDYSETGGTLIEKHNDFYLGFLVRPYDPNDERTWVGWYHVSVDDNLEMTLLDAGIGLYGEAVLVGIGPIPEPTGAMLALVGMALLALRRKRSLRGLELEVTK